MHHHGEFGVLVLGHARPALLQAVLDSLAMQGALPHTHVWLDGSAGRREFGAQVRACAELARGYALAELRAHGGHLGIEKLMLDALHSVGRRYARLLVLEDDCFPAADAVREFDRALRALDEEPGIYSVYGHPFGIAQEPQAITRFQGWGWGTTRERLLPVLAELQRLHALSEADYLAFVRRTLTPELRARLDITPGRDVLSVLERFFSWDSATALVTAMRGLRHRMTPHRTIWNCGLGGDTGHFADQARFRAPPFNMIGPDETWDHFSSAQRPDGEPLSPYHGLERLDARIAQYLTDPIGTFVELGAYDGVRQSNTLYFERKGWRGVLIEPTPVAFARCKANRPLAQVFHYACVAAPGIDQVQMTDVGLMSIVDGTRAPDIEQRWVERGEAVQQIERKTVRVPARTLSAILDEAGVQRIDLLSLDVEGGELQVLAGLDLERHRPRWIVAEDAYEPALEQCLTGAGYRVAAVLLERAHTRDVLYQDTRGTPRAAPEARPATAEDPVKARLRLTPKRVLGGDGQVFDLDSRQRWPLPPALRADLERLGALPPQFTLAQLDAALDDASGTRSARLVAQGWVGDARAIDPIRHYLRSVAIETCTPCAGRCVYCPVSTHPRRAPRFMDMALFELILERIGARALNFVALNIYSEPLLHPQFARQAELLARAGHPLALFTTASQLKPALAEHLAALGNVQRVVVNFPSADPQLYRQFMGVKMPRELISQLRHAHAIGLPLQICVNGLTHSAQRSQEILAALVEDDGAAPRAFVNYTHNRAGALQGSENLARDTWTGELRGCRRAVEDLTVTVDGKVILCCEDFHQEHVLGDLTRQTIDEVLDGERARSYRRRIFGLDAADSDFICRKCAEAWRAVPGEALPRADLI